MLTWACVVGVLGLSGVEVEGSETETKEDGHHDTAAAVLNPVVVTDVDEDTQEKLGDREGFSVSVTCNSEFFYSQNIYRRSEDCNVCFGKECLTLDKARCDYYAEADSILPKDEEVPGGSEDAGKRREVDDLMFELVEKGLYTNMQCIPYVSRYTNCNKDNACLGCKTCSCSPEGRWNCTSLQPCHSKAPPLNIDHRVLLVVMEAITDRTHSRISKRSVTDNPRDTASTISLAQLSEWLYGSLPLSMMGSGAGDRTSTPESTAVEDNERDDGAAATVTGTSSSSPGLTTTEKATTNEDSDYIAFEEVLRSIAVEPSNDNRSLTDNKSLDNETNNQAEFNFDYMIMDEDNTTEIAPNNKLNDVINVMLDYDDVVTEAAVTNATAVVIDLLETAGNSNTSVNVTEDFPKYNKYEDLDIFDNINEIIEHNAFNIMKRDVAGQTNTTAPNVVPAVTIILNTTNITTSTNKTEDNTDLKENVLMPLNKIISEKMKELENLKKIKDDLLKFVKSDNSTDEITKDNNITSNTYFSIYNVAVATGLDIELRRADPSKYDKYMLKLKTDIYEVIRDIYGIRKYKNSDIPYDLKLLVNAMQRYVYKNNLFEKPKKENIGKLRNYRRRMEPTSRCLTFKDCLTQVIQIIDEDMPKFNALSPLSPASRNIMKHVIKSNYVDQLSMPGLRVYDPNYNLSNYLNSIGTKWQAVTANLIGSTPFESLYRMKLLHCTLTLDISKMDDAIGLVEFAHNRRMTASLDKVSDSTFDNIDAGLTEIHNKIVMLIKYYTRTPETQGKTAKPRVVMTLHKETTNEPIIINIETTTNDLPEIRKKKKHSFIRHIRRLLKTSKHDIKDMLHKKVPKSEIVRHLAQKKLDELSVKRYGEYEETMKKWQRNLDLTSRAKRSVLDQFKTRIKNIIPGYLRRRVNPKIKENQKNATAEAERKAGRKKKRKGKKEHKTRKTLSKPGVRSKTITIRPTPHFPTAGLPDLELS